MNGKKYSSRFLRRRRKIQKVELGTQEGLSSKLDKAKTYMKEKGIDQPRPVYNRGEKWPN